MTERRAAAQVARQAKVEETERVRSAVAEKHVRRALWLGAIAPFLVTVPKSAAEIETVAIGPIDYARALVPATCLLLAWLSHGTRRPRPRGAVEWLLIAFLVVAVGSTAWSLIQLQTFLKAGVLAMQYVILMELVRRYDSTAEALRALLSTIHFLALTVLATLIVAPQYAIGASIGDPIPRLHGAIPRLDSNPLGFVLVVALLALMVGVGPKWTMRPGWRVSLFAVYVLMLLATRTRTATAFAMALLLIALILLMRRTAWAAVATCVLGVLAISAALLANDQIATFAARGQSIQGLTTLTGRTAVWEAALSVWERQPWQGYGFFSHRVIRLNAYLGTNYGNYDNTWVEMLVGVGVIGTTLLALFVLAAAVRLFQQARVLDFAEFSLRLLIVLLGIVTSFINPTLQQTAVVAVVLGFTLLLPRNPVLASAKNPR